MVTLIAVVPYHKILTLWRIVEIGMFDSAVLASLCSGAFFSVTSFLFWFLGGLRCWLWTRCIDECTNYHIWNHQHYNYYTYHQSESSENKELLFHQGVCYHSFGSMIYFRKGTHSDTFLTKCCKFTINTCLHSPVFGYSELINASSNDLTWIQNPSMQAQNLAVQRYLI